MTTKLVSAVCAAICVAVHLASTAAPVAAQTSTADLVRKATEQANQINEVLRALQTADPNTQYALVKILLEEKEPALRRIGREFALFSTNPVLRNMAIISVFNTSAQVRLQLTGAADPEVYGWAEQMGGASGGDSASVMLATVEYNGSCWAASNGACRWYIQGERVQLYDKSNSRFAQADLALGVDGVLRGPIVMNSGRAQVSIDLK